MARRLSWSDVRGGLIAITVLLAAALAVLVFLRVGALHGRTFRLYALVGDARGVTAGSEVWLNGQKIGKITDITFLPATADTAHRIRIGMDVLEQYRDAMRHDALAQIRAGGSIMGPPVVYLSAGTPQAPPLQPEDTVAAKPQPDYEEASAKFGMASKEFPVIIANLTVLSAQLKGAEGTLGALMNGPGSGEMGRARIRATQLVNRLTGGGTAGLIMRGGLSVRAQRVMARADSVRALLASPRSSFGRFRRDSTLITEVADIRNELTLVRADLAGSGGTLGRASSDSGLTNALGEAQQQMTLLLADLKKHPLRYLSF